MAYISLYRKYRPQTFEDVVGQEHVTTTLRNAIKEGRVGSGYLFTGTRGTAKTTCARILAKALNCIGPDGKLTVPTPEPCGACGPCTSVAASSFVDVIEMDAASHRGIDDMRDIVSSIKFPPMEGRYKVYIIDEAHQLTAEAKDAFLKTLEEPPDRVIFILATTELERMPITIRSRCQVYEFKRGSIPQISSKLAEVLKAEKVSADPAAVTLIARAADGSYRDSLSLLEQVLAYTRERLTAPDVNAVLGTMDDDLLAQVVSLIADSDAAGAFALVGEILESGKDIRQFLKSLTQRFRDMLYVGVGARPAQAGDLEDSPTLREQASRFAPAALLEALDVLTETEQETKRSNQHRLLLEMALLRLMRLPQTVSVPSFVAVPQNGFKAAPAAPAPAVLVVADDMPPPITEDDEDDVDMLAALPMLGDDDLDSLPLDDEADSLPSLLVVSAEDHAEADDLLQLQQVAADPAPASPPPAPNPDASPELKRLQKSWQEVINRMSSRPSTAALMRDGEPVSLNGNLIILQFESAFSVEKLEGNERGREVVAEAINKTLGVEAGYYKIKAILKGHAAPTVKTPQNPAPKVQETAKPLAAPSPFVDEVIAVFGGRLLDDDETKG